MFKGFVFKSQLTHKINLTIVCFNNLLRIAFKLKAATHLQNIIKPQHTCEKHPTMISRNTPAEKKRKQPVTPSP